MLIFSTQINERTVADRNCELELLLARVATGDRDALGALYRCARTAVYGLALSYLKCHADAEDITQSTFVRVWENACQYQSQGKPMSWLLAIARNLSLMALRRRRREDILTEEEWAALPDLSQRLTPEDLHTIQVLLDALDDQERRIVVLHAVTGLKHREIAALLELPLSTVLSKYSRSIKKLRKQLEGDDAP